MRFEEGYIVFICRRCGRFIYAKKGQKTKKCVCGYTNDLRRVKVVRRVRDEREAGEVVRILQAGKGLSGFKRLS